MENFIDNESFIVEGNWLSILKLKSSQKQKRSCEEWLADVYRQDKIKKKGVHRSNMCVYCQSNFENE